MKKIHLIIMTFSVILASGCTGNGNGPEENASAFLNSYFNADLEQAAQYCTEEISEILKKGKAEIEKNDSSVISIFKRELQKMEVSIEKSRLTGDTAFVNYSLLNRIDSTIKRNTLKLRNQDGKWLVFSLN